MLINDDQQPNGETSEQVRRTLEQVRKTKEDSRAGKEDKLLRWNSKDLALHLQVGEVNNE